MGVKRSQIQNLIIYIGDVFGITIGYFLMSHIDFIKILTEYGHRIIELSIDG